MNDWTWVVAFGVLCEIGFIIWGHCAEFGDWKYARIHFKIRFPSRPSLIKLLLEILSVALVVAGIVGELTEEAKLGKLDSDIQDANNQQVALLQKESSKIEHSTVQLKIDLLAQEQATADAEKEAAAASERASQNEITAAEMNADNLVLQKVLVARQFDPFALNIGGWFFGTRAFPRMDVYIQSASDKEAENFAHAIAFELQRNPVWNIHWVDENESQVSVDLTEGIVLWGTMERLPRGLDWRKDVEWVALSERHLKACEALANALTSAGFAVGDQKLKCALLTPPYPGHPRLATAHPLPLLAKDGVYVQVGVRPISATVQWLNARREERIKKKATSASRPAALSRQHHLDSTSLG